MMLVSMYTPRIRARQPFLKFDIATWAFPKIDMQHGDPSDMRQGIILDSSCDKGL